jgi:acid phosphatase type 7
LASITVSSNAERCRCDLAAERRRVLTVPLPASTPRLGSNPGSSRQKGAPVIRAHAKRLACLTTIASVIALLVPFANATAADPVFVGAGDIASCTRTQDLATSRLLDRIPGTVFTAGDNVYEHGSATEFARCYAGTWGRHKARTRPAVGDEEYETAGARGYFGYFGSRAGDPRRGYYSFDIGAWHAVVLNTNCAEVGGCGMTSPQLRWLQTDLATRPRACTIAIFHHPRFTSRRSSPDGRSVNMWRVLYANGADLIVNGHSHQYERFAPQTPDGVASAYGIRQFVVGTGGAALVPLPRIVRNSQVRNGTTYGVLRLTLHASSYDFAFIPIAGQTFRDSGTTRCHGRPPAARG